MRRLPLLLIPLAALCACGSSSGTPDAGEAPIDLEAYFGLQEGRCFEYVAGDTAAAVPDLGVAVEEIVEAPFKAHVIFYRQGSLAMKDFVGLEGSELKLYKREWPGNKSVLYTPPLTWMRAPLRAGTVVESSATAAIRDGAGNLTVDPPPTHTLRVDVFAPQATALPIGQSVDASPLIYTETPGGRHEVRAFFPGTGDPARVDGFVKIDLNFTPDDSAASTIYKLQGLRQLDGTVPCGMAP
jgi:hypothetical protein